MSIQPKVRTCLWFERDGATAARLYVSLLPDSRLESEWGTREGEPLVINFTLAGTPYQILNGGPHFKLTEAASISVMTEDQDETDRLWHALTADGGEESQCGWLRDRWGVSWQIVPEALLKMVSAADRDAAGRAEQAMYGMRKIDIAAIDRAFRGEA